MLWKSSLGRECWGKSVEAYRDRTAIYAFELAGLKERRATSLTAQPSLTIVFDKRTVRDSVLKPECASEILANLRPTLSKGLRRAPYPLYARDPTGLCSAPRPTRRVTCGEAPFPVFNRRRGGIALRNAVLLSCMEQVLHSVERRTRITINPKASSLAPKSSVLSSRVSISSMPSAHVTRYVGNLAASRVASICAEASVTAVYFVIGGIMTELIPLSTRHETCALHYV